MHPNPIQSKYNIDFPKFISNNFKIVDKYSEEVAFVPNKVQLDFYKNIGIANIILKARQLGLTSFVLAIFTVIFLLFENQTIFFVAQDKDNAEKLLKKVKFYIESFEKKNGVTIPLGYNSKSELSHKTNNSTFYVGTAGSATLGRGSTITCLHLSEVAFYTNGEELIAGIKQALVPGGLSFLESTANGFNFFEEVWSKSVDRELNYKPHFYGSNWQYTTEFLDDKKKELRRLFPQEYPMSPEDAFLTSGECYFNTIVIKSTMDKNKNRKLIPFQYVSTIS